MTESQLPDSWRAVYDLVALIPVGRVTTYGHVARCLRLSGGARTVGWALNHLNRTEHGLPAHRVVNRNGMLTGRLHFGAPNRMQSLLEAEGVVVEGQQVRDFKTLLWDPSVELEEDIS